VIVAAGSSRDTIEARLLSPDLAARYLGLTSRWSIYRLVSAGELPPVRIAGKLRIDRADLDRFIEARKTASSRAAPASPMVRAPSSARAHLEPLAPPSRDGDRTVTPAAQHRAPLHRLPRTSDITSRVRPRKEAR
jgi:excisionase family DNA binding protein